jgi:nicotinate-nucleotide adenylyltransferase
MPIGLYFGSFNPIHIGHLIIANHVLNLNQMEQIWFVVTPQNPFKPAKSLLNEFDRLHLVQIAVENDSRLRASDIEFKLPKPSYTSHTLAYLKENYPNREFSILMGSDSFQNLPKWKNADQIIKNYPILIYLRPGFSVENDHGAKANILEAPLLNISASEIRKLSAQGKSIKYLVPDVVEQEIIKSRLYKAQNK